MNSLRRSSLLMLLFLIEVEHFSRWFWNNLGLIIQTTVQRNELSEASRIFGRRRRRTRCGYSWFSRLGFSRRSVHPEIPEMSPSAWRHLFMLATFIASPPTFGPSVIVPSFSGGFEQSLTRLFGISGPLVVIQLHSITLVAGGY
jgi:hypothetical protein